MAEAAEDVHPRSVAVAARILRRLGPICAEVSGTGLGEEWMAAAAIEEILRTRRRRRRRNRGVSHFTLGYVRLAEGERMPVGAGSAVGCAK